DLVAEFSAKQLIHRYTERFASQIPQCGFNGGEYGNKHSRLRTFEETTLPDVFEQPVYIQWVSSLQSLSEKFHKMIGAGRGIHTLTTSPDVLVGIYFYKEAMSSAYITTFDFRDLEA